MPSRSDLVGDPPRFVSDGLYISLRIHEVLVTERDVRVTWVQRGWKLDVVIGALNCYDKSEKLRKVRFFILADPESGQSSVRTLIAVPNAWDWYPAEQVQT